MLRIFKDKNHTNPPNPCNLYAIVIYKTLKSWDKNSNHKYFTYL